MVAKPSQIFWRVIEWYQIARLKGEISFWVVYAIAIYLPFEEFVLRWTPAPSIGILFLRFLHEFILYYLWGKVFYKRIIRRERIIQSSIELALICFAFWALILLVVHQTSIFSGVNNLRTLLRYISVYYIIVDVKLSRKQVSLLIKTILILGLIQGYLVSVQYFAPAGFNNLFVPQNINLEVGGASIQKSSEVSSGNLKTGAVNGTLANTANTSAFLLIGFIILVVFTLQSPNISKYFLSPKIINFFVMYFAFFATYKRIALLFGLVIPVLVLFLYRQKLWASKVIWFYLLGGFTLIFCSLFFLNVDTSIDGWAIRQGENIDLLGYFGQLFSPEYWEKGTRQWILKTIFQGTITTGNWFGLSPAPNGAVQKLIEILPSKENIILERKFWFEDVYWAAMLLYYGIPGVALFGYIFQRLYKTSQYLIDNCLEIQTRVLGIAFCTFIIITIFYGFIERIFEIKCFSFYLWLFAGLVVNVYSSNIQQFHNQASFNSNRI